MQCMFFNIYFTTFLESEDIVKPRDVEVVKLLVQNGAIVKIKDHYGISPLALSLKIGTCLSHRIEQN